MIPDSASVNKESGASSTPVCTVETLCVCVCVCLYVEQTCVCSWTASCLMVCEPIDPSLIQLSPHTHAL